MIDLLCSCFAPLVITTAESPPATSAVDIAVNGFRAILALISWRPELAVSSQDFGGARESKCGVESVGGFDCTLFRFPICFFSLNISQTSPASIFSNCCFRHYVLHS